MQVQVHTDNHVVTSEALKQQVEDEVKGVLGRFEQRLTRVEVHLGDTNSSKEGGHDKRCSVEARPAGRQPVAVHHTAGTLDQALTGAVEKMERLLDHDFGRLDDR